MTAHTLVERAAIFAAKAHANAEQLRKYTGEPYVMHPARVVALVRSVPHTDNMLAAAWLHDVVEDCDVELQDIERWFGYEVRDYVAWLSDEDGEGNRAIRKSIYCAAIARAPAEVQTIKLADLIDNTSDIVLHDPKFARVYMAEKAALLDVLRKGDATLQRKARLQLAMYFASQETI